MGFSLIPRESEYFALFSQMTAKIIQASDILVEMVESKDGDPLSFTTRIKEIEHACDEITHKITTKLNKSFITPFDREDIYHLAGALDDVCDYIDAAARAARMYDINEFSDRVKAMAKIIQKLAIEINESVLMLRKPIDLNKHIVEIHRLENAADDEYFRGIAELFKDADDPMLVIKWKEIYEILENATDRCESVANIIESIVLKHN